MEQHPPVTVPLRVALNVFVETKDALAAHARLTTWEKEYLGNYFFLKKPFGPVSLEINVHREVICRRVVTGTREEPAMTVEVVEWHCDETALLAQQG